MNRNGCISFETWKNLHKLPFHSSSTPSSLCHKRRGVLIVKLIARITKFIDPTRYRSVGPCHKHVTLNRTTKCRNSKGLIMVGGFGAL